MNNFSIGGIVSLTSATQALLTDITDILNLPAIMTAQALAGTIQECREISRILDPTDRELLDELLSDLEPLADFSLLAPPDPRPAPAVVDSNELHDA